VSGSVSGPDALLRSHADARADMREFRRHFFGPWALDAADPAFVRSAVKELGREPEQRGFAENLHPWSEEAWQRMRDNADVPGLEAGRFGRPRAAITVRSTDLRAAPTMKPRFSQVQGAGRGWPFDLFQQSALPVGLPLAVVHQSRDGAWLFVESSVSWGWVRAEDVAFAGAAFQKVWTRERLAAFVREGVGLCFRSLGLPGTTKGTPLIRPGAYLAEGNIGTVLPSARSGEVLLPLRGLDGEAYVVTASYAEYGARPAAGADFDADPLQRPAVIMPQSLTARAVALIGDRMMGQTYGWGGLYGGRDCSAMMRDLFAAFGLWLPRNSSAQSEEGMRFDFVPLSSEGREKALLRQGRPFLTLVHFPGHIALYVGEWEGRPVIFHNMWGIRHTLDDGREGRLVLGRALISTLRPGQERGDVEEGSLLLRRMDTISIISGEDK